MSTIVFELINDLPAGTNVRVSFNDKDGPFIEDVLSAFEQFLLGVTFQPESISKYLDVKKVQDALLKRAQLVSKYDSPR